MVQRAALHEGSAGFSIAEAVIALAVIATGVLAMSGLAVRTTDMVVRARHRAVASQLADAGVTELAARAIAPAGDGCLLGDTPGCVEYLDASGEVVDETRAAYALRWSAAPVLATPVPATAITVCAVPAYERSPAARPAGACVSRVVMEPWP